MKRVFISSLLVLAILVSFSGLATAVEEFRVSELGGGIQIWFEAEAFDERVPEGNQYFRVTGEPGVPDAPDGAFGEAVTRSGGAGGMIRWTFDLSRTEGGEGIWYFWGRVHNPGNLSDYMLVEGDPDDDIPAGPPFPGGDMAAPFDNVDDRIFENTMVDWAWWGNSEGSNKELQDGENTMYIFHRQGSATVFWDVFMWTDSAVYRPSDDDYTNAEVMKASDIAVQPMKKLSATWGRLKSDL
jgi:hypothetical protein